LERKQADSVNLTPASDKKKKRKRDKATKTSNKTNVKATKSEKTDVVSSAKGSGDSEEFVPHDYVKASLTTQLQGTLSGGVLWTYDTAYLMNLDISLMLQLLKNI